MSFPPISSSFSNKKCINMIFKYMVGFPKQSRSLNLLAVQSNSNSKCFIHRQHLSMIIAHRQYVIVHQQHNKNMPKSYVLMNLPSRAIQCLPRLLMFLLVPSMFWQSMIKHILYFCDILVHCSHGSHLYRLRTCF